MTKVQLEAEIARLQGLVDSKATVVAEVVETQEKRQDMAFIDFRDNGDYVLEVTGACEIHLSQRNSFDKDTRGLPPLGSWILMHVKKVVGTNDGVNKVKGVKSYLISKNKKGYMYVGKIAVPEEKEAQQEKA